MSWEGYEQHICKNGHFFNSAPDYEAICSVCKEESAFRNLVDCTNGLSQGLINVLNLEKIAGERVEICNLGHPHITAPARFKIPTEELPEYILE